MYNLEVTYYLAILFDMVKINKVPETTNYLSVNSNLPINLGYKLDSFRVYIPLEKVEIINDYFGSKCVITNAETGATQGLDEAILKREYRDETHPNIRTSFYIDSKLKFNGIEEGPAPKHLVVFVNAKQLKTKYLQGITKETIRSVYDYIISLGAVKFSYEDFLSANILDIDVCKDFLSYDIANHNEIRDKIFNSLIRGVGSEFRKVVKKYRTTTLYYNQDRERATIGMPHIKLYDKTAELRGYRDDQDNSGGKKVRDNSLSFYIEYLAGTAVDQLISQGIIRLEYTLKNRNAYKHFGLDQVRTLRDILEVDNDTLDEVCKKMFSKYYKTTIMKEPINKEEQSLVPDKLALLDMIEYILSLAPDKNNEDILKIATRRIRGYKDSSTLSKKRSEIRELIDKYLAPEVREKLEINTQKDKTYIEVLKSIGLYD